MIEIEPTIPDLNNTVICRVLSMMYSRAYFKKFFGLHKWQSRRGLWDESPRRFQGSGGSRNWFGRGTWRARGARAYNGGLGRSPQRGPGWSGGQGAKPPWSWKPLSFRPSSGSGKNASFSLLCNHNKLGFLRSEPKPNVPLGWGSRGAWPLEAERLFDLGIVTYNGSGKFRALGHVIKTGLCFLFFCIHCISRSFKHAGLH